MFDEDIDGIISKIEYGNINSKKTVFWAWVRWQEPKTFELEEAFEQRTPSLHIEYVH